MDIILEHPGFSKYLDKIVFRNIDCIFYFKSGEVKRYDRRSSTIVDDRNKSNYTMVIRRRLIIQFLRKNKTKVYTTARLSNELDINYQTAMRDLKALEKLKLVKSSYTRNPIYWSIK